MKKFISIGLVLMILLGQFSVVGVAEEDNPTTPPNVTLRKVEPSRKTIEVGDVFNVKFSFIVNKESNDNAKIYIKVGSSSSFLLTDNNFEKELITSNTSSEGSVSFNFKYLGGNDYKIPIIISYERNGNYKELEPIKADLPNINPIEPEEPEKPEPIDGTKFVPNLALVSSKTITVESGKSTYIPLSIKNTSSHDAEDISITPELDGASPISIEGSGYESISRLYSGRTKDIDFRINVDEHAESKTYPIKINFQFYNEYGIPFTGSETIYVKVENKNTRPLITIVKLDTIPKVAEPGKVTVVGFELKNTGTLEAKEMKVSLNGLSPDTFTLTSGFSNKYIKNIPGGSSSYVYFEISPSEKLAGGNHSLELMLNYKDGRGQAHEDSSKFL